MKGIKLQGRHNSTQARAKVWAGRPARRQGRWSLGVGLVALAVLAHAGDVYRYQDSDGRWRFSDRKPPGQHETLRFQSRREAAKPTLAARGLENGGFELYADNPLWTPVLFQLRENGEVVLETLVPARDDQPLAYRPEGPGWREKLNYRYYLGDPSATFDGQPLLPPVAQSGRFRITQAFGGRYSHTAKASYYAIDVAMQVGDAILAAREGVVVTVKDDYPMGGRSDYFLDKANLIRVLHADGSFAVYGHILLGSATVVEGQQVAAGDPLARCGSSGFSTGPHLHFAVQLAEADDNQWRSVPFQFRGANGDFTPVVQQWLGRE